MSARMTDEELYGITGYPLQGYLVSGLHVENNLQILTAAENIRKSNDFEVEA